MGKIWSIRPKQWSMSICYTENRQVVKSSDSGGTDFLINVKKNPWNTGKFTEKLGDKTF